MNCAPLIPLTLLHFFVFNHKSLAEFVWLKLLEPRHFFGFLQCHIVSFVLCALDREDFAVVPHKVVRLIEIPTAAYAPAAIADFDPTVFS